MWKGKLIWADGSRGIRPLTTWSHVLRQNIMVAGASKEESSSPWWAGSRTVSSEGSGTPHAARDFLPPVKPHFLRFLEAPIPAPPSADQALQALPVGGHPTGCLEALGGLCAVEIHLSSAQITRPQAPVCLAL